MADNTDWKACADAAESAVGVLRDALAVAANYFEWHVPKYWHTPPSRGRVQQVRAALTSTAEAAAARDARLTEPLKAYIATLEDVAEKLVRFVAGDVWDVIDGDTRRKSEAFQRAVVAVVDVIEAGDVGVDDFAARIRDEGRREGIEEAARFVGTNVHQTIATAVRALLDKPAGEDGR